jgi:hypothetical protein
MYLAHNLNRKIEINTNSLEFIFRSLLDLARHMQDELPHGVYSYNSYILKQPIKNIIAKVEKDKKEETSL